MCVRVCVRRSVSFVYIYSFVERIRSIRSSLSVLSRTLRNYAVQHSALCGIVDRWMCGTQVKLGIVGIQVVRMLEYYFGSLDCFNKIMIVFMVSTPMNQMFMFCEERLRAFFRAHFDLSTLCHCYANFGCLRCETNLHETSFVELNHSYTSPSSL